VRLALEEEKAKFEAQYEAFKEIYDRRKMRAELLFGHIKRNLKTAAFVLRGMEGVQAETSLLATCFDLRRMMTILGVTTDTAPKSVIRPTLYSTPTNCDTVSRRRGIILVF
jgi:hypothetical protein